MTYSDFLNGKRHQATDAGFEVGELNPALYDFQEFVVQWLLKKGRAAIFSDCGTGKSFMQLEWAKHVHAKTGKPVLILTPLAVAPQTVEEGARFGIECTRSKEGKVYPITVTNYQRLHHFNPADFGACVCDESGILKNFQGKFRQQITAFQRKMSYRLLATATPSPNDYIELGTSSEALGHLGYVDMLNKFFVNQQNNSSMNQRMYGEAPKWSLKGHAQTAFWRWVTSWALAIRKPSDIGFDDAGFILPELIERNHITRAKDLLREDADGQMIISEIPARGLRDQRVELRNTVEERCERAADLVNRTGEPSIVWCHANSEGDLLEKLIPDAIQVAGKDSDDAKEDKLTRFANNQERVLVTKPKIGAWGLNLQHCNHVVYFPSHSYEQYYQAIRRCWRFGQKRPVTVDVVLTEGQLAVMDNLKQKAVKADRMFEMLVQEMNYSKGIEHENRFTKKMEVPAWL